MVILARKGSIRPGARAIADRITLPAKRRFTSLSRTSATDQRKGLEVGDPGREVDPIVEPGIVAEPRETPAGFRGGGIAHAPAPSAGAPSVSAIANRR